MSITLRGYQRETIKKALALEGRMLIANDMGTGKTVCAIAIARMLHVTKVLVVAPLSVVSIWKREVRDYWPGQEFIDCTKGTIRERSDLLDTAMAGVVAVGYESYWREPLRQSVREFEPDLIIFDEGHRIKNRSAKQSRFAHYLALHVSHRLVLTATPMTKGPEDLYSLFRFVNPGVFGTRWQDFEWRYLIKGGFQGRMIVGYRNREELEQRLHAWSTRITKKEAMDLPEEQPVEIKVQMSDRARETYDALAEHAVAEVESLNGETGTALSRIVITNILRLKQVTSGFVKLEDGREVDLDTTKLDTLKDLLLDMPQRVVVFCHFTRDIDRIQEMVSKQERDSWVLDGRKTATQRALDLEMWEKSDGGILICQIAVSSLGIDLTGAHTAIYYSVDYNLTNWIQCHGRLHRHGQTNKVTNYYLITERSIDEKVYEALARKEDLTRAVLDLSAARELFTV